MSTWASATMLEAAAEKAAAARLESLNSPLLDLRNDAKPEKFDGPQDQWSEWRFVWLHCHVEALPASRP